MILRIDHRLSPGACRLCLTAVFFKNKFSHLRHGFSLNPVLYATTQAHAWRVLSYRAGRTGAFG